MTNATQGYAEHSLANLRRGWTAAKVDHVIDVVPTGKPYDAKSVTPMGITPVLDQKASGFFGYHQHAPSVRASNEVPLVTFSNHRCNLRLMREPFSVIQNVFAFRGYSAVTDTRFLFYWLKNRIEPEEYKGYFPTLRSLWLALPPLDEQRRIAEVLGALDDLIDTNERLADQLMELARTVTRGAAESVVPLIELAEIAPFRTVTPIGETAHYSLPAFDNGAMPERPDGVGIKSNKIFIDGSVVLISRLNPHIPRVWAVYPDADVMNVASTEFVPMRGVGVSTEEVYALVSSDAYLAQLSSRVTGTTGSHQRVDKRALLDLTVPDLRLLQPDVRVAIREVVQEAHASRVMCATLRRTRDELLPLLTSGRVRVRPEGVSA